MQVDLSKADMNMAPFPRRVATLPPDVRIQDPVSNLLGN
jgi:hypothetical protein